MIAFAELLDRLTLTPGRLAKIALMRRFFETEADPDRGWALAALTGELSFTAAKAGLIRSVAEARVDPVLFRLSYDFVGDLAETTALIWPAASEAAPPGLAEVVGILAECPVCTSQTDHRGFACRRLGAPGQDRPRRVRVGARPGAGA